MGTDAKATVEITTREGLTALPSSLPLRVPYPWANVDLVRDYVLFDLLAGGRSDDPADAVVPIRRVRWPDATADDPASTWVTATEVAHVADVYRERTGTESAQLRAIAAMMHALGQEGAVRLVVRFF